MNPELEETIYFDFITSSPSTGAAADADSTPTCEVFEDANDAAILTPAVTKRTGKTGNYRLAIACTAANGFEAGKSYNVVAAAIVGGVAAKAVVQTFQMRTNGADDLAASILTRATPAQVNTEVDTALTDVGLTNTVTGRIDASVSSRAMESSVASRSSQLSVDMIDGLVQAIKVVTDRLNTALELDGSVYRYTANALELAPTGGGGTVPTVQEIADMVLKRDWTAMTADEPTFCLLQAARILRCIWNTTEVANTLTVKKENGTTTAWSRPLTTDPTAQPITGVT